MIIPHHDPHARLRTVVRTAFRDAMYESAEPKEGGQFIITGRRSDGRKVHVRFRGVTDAEASDPSLEGPLSLASVRSAERFSLLRLRFPFGYHAPTVGSSRVRINAGKGTIEVVCQDAEWWEGDV